jgi:hypothetical protein
LVSKQMGGEYNLRALSILNGDGGKPPDPAMTAIQRGLRADPHDLEVVVDVLTPDAVRIAPGAPVRIERWGGDRSLEGRVRLVEPSGYTKLSGPPDSAASRCTCARCRAISSPTA